MIFNMKDFRMTPIKRVPLLVLILLLILVPGSLSALTVKLASPFPEGTEWDNTLKKMAAEWADITNGQVRMRIYPGGVAGDDADMVRKMRFGQIDAAVLTSFGMKSIVPNSFVMTLPGLMHSDAELDAVIEDFAPSFDQNFIAEGFRVLTWSKSGWAYFFSKNSAGTPMKMRSEKLAISSSDVELAEAFKALRFNIIPMALNELMVGLQSGMATAYYAPPMASAAYQWFAQAPYMIDLPIAPVLGGMVISERTWSRIPESYHGELKQAIEDVAKVFAAESDRINAEAMSVMLRHGLKVLDMDDNLRSEWFSVLTAGHDLVVGDGKWVDRGVYEDFISRLEEMR